VPPKIKTRKRKPSLARYDTIEKIVGTTEVETGDYFEFYRCCHIFSRVQTSHWMWWCKPEIPAFGRPVLENH
jgi:hypothetical protein